MKKIFLILTILLIAVISTACINNFAVQELNNKAKILMENGDYEGAINRLEASMDLDNTIFETYYNLGVAYIKARKYEKAIDILSKGVKINPDLPDTYYSLAVAQDAYAQEIMNYVDKPTQTNSDDSIDEYSEELQPVNPIQNMSKEERKTKVKDLFEKAKCNYEFYLDNSKDAKDIDEVKNQIKNIEESISKSEIK